jgi:rhodanese-related sulfurtransferase
MAHGPRFEKLTSDAKSRIQEITPNEAADAQKKGVMLIDVREADDFAAEHAKGAVHLSKGVVELKIEQLAPDPATPVVCYCGGGNRSALVADNLQKMGYRNVSSMAGGFKAWRTAGLPIES